ncbi:butyrate kinase [uncultured Ilyobacter sp.]|uniref:butyrate kinase n=1 Tax=uncultured Ilyobacter sp. TaxID=544433 RepID=UPI0029C66CD6|nr:butyrate kinase [uncultured Ilyobacter sp.]
MGKYILAINPGSTSTKIAVYEDKRILFEKKIEHSAKELSKFQKITDQYEMRYKEIENILSENEFKLQSLSGIVGRGGPVAPLESGAYIVNEIMVEKLMNAPMVDHASNLGGVIAYNLAKPLGIPAFIYDAVSTDQLTDIARISGIKEVSRKSLVHALNMRAVGMRCAEKLEKNYNELNFIIAHLGGGITVAVHEKGRMTDLISDDEGPFSPERAGRVPCKDLVNMCYVYDKDTMKKKLRGQGGLISYLGSNSTIEIEERIRNGDKYAKLIYEAMAYQISKGICELTAVLKGKVDMIIITGGVAHSEMITNWIKERVRWIAPIEVTAGGDELEALAHGALRVIRGEEKVHEFKNHESSD